jgi:hypothetical protein
MMIEKKIFSYQIPIGKLPCFHTEADHFLKEGWIIENVNTNILKSDRKSSLIITLFLYKPTDEDLFGVDKDSNKTGITEK